MMLPSIRYLLLIPMTLSAAACSPTYNVEPGLFQGYQYPTPMVGVNPYIKGQTLEVAADRKSAVLKIASGETFALALGVSTTERKCPTSNGESTVEYVAAKADKAIQVGELSFPDPVLSSGCNNVGLELYDNSRRDAFTLALHFESARPSADLSNTIAAPPGLERDQELRDVGALP
jgi:hypothetical protein